MSKNEVIEIPNYDGAGIYAIINIEDFGVYVGSSHNIRKRAIQHGSAMKSKYHTIEQLNKDGAFDFVVLAEFGADYEEWQLRVHEWMYMYCFKEKGFKLYNKYPKPQTKEKFFDDIALDTIRGLKIRDVIENKVHDMYGVHSWYLKIRKSENRRFR